MFALDTCTRLWRQLLVLPSILALPIVFLLAGCKSDTERARSKLNELEVRYSKASFFDRIHRGDRKVVELFLKSGMNADVLNVEGKSALNIAVREANRDVVEMLLKEGADPKGKSQLEEAEGWTDVKDLGNSPLAAAHWSYVSAAKSNEMLREKYFAIAELLLDEGANVDSENRAGNTLLINAAAGFQPELISLYLEHGADVNHVGNGKETPFTAVFSLPVVEKSRKEIEVIRKLLEAGADINHQNKQGNTALMKVRKSKIEIIKLLLKSGANPEIRNHDGKTALLQTLELSIRLDATVEDERGLKNEKALMLARNVDDVSRSEQYLRNKGYEEFAEKLSRVNKYPLSY